MLSDESSLSDRASSAEASSASGTIRSNSSIVAVQTPTNSVPNPALLAINGSKKMFLKPATPPKLHLASLKPVTTSLNGRCRNDEADAVTTVTPGDASGELVSVL